MAEDALTKSLLFLEQQRDDGIAIRADNLSVISRLINHGIVCHGVNKLLLKST